MDGDSARGVAGCASDLRALRFLKLVPRVDALFPDNAGHHRPRTTNPSSIPKVK